MEEEERKEKARQESRARAGRWYMEGLSMEDGATIDEAMDSIDRYFNVDEGCHRTDGEVIFFFDSMVIAGEELLRNEGLPTESQDLAELEWHYQRCCALQPAKPKYMNRDCSKCKEDDKYCEVLRKKAYICGRDEYINALEEWKSEHSKYWKRLEGEPEVRLFSNEKLVAAYRLKGIFENVATAITEKRLFLTVAEVIKFVMLAVRIGVYDKVTGFAISNKQHRKGADVTNAKYRKAQDFCINEAAERWREDALLRMGWMLAHLEASLIEKQIPAPIDKNTIKRWLSDAEKEGKLSIPPAARKGGAPKKYP